MEKFDINKKIDSKEYRKNLADELRVVIQELGFEKGRERLTEETSKGKEGIYLKAKEEKLAQWLIQKYLQNSVLFDEQVLINMSEREITDKVFEERKKGGVSEEFNKIYYEKLLYGALDKKYENGSNFQSLKGFHSDIILNKDLEKKNKYIVIEVLGPRLSFSSDSLLGLTFKEKEEYEKLRGLPNNEKEVFINKRTQLEIERMSKNQRYLTEVIIARPYPEDGGFDQHSQLRDNFKKDREMGVLNDENEIKQFEEKETPPYKMDSIDINLFVKKVIDIVNIEPDFKKALKKIEEIQFQIQTPNKTDYSILVKGGGYMEPILNDGGEVVGTSFYGRSDRFGSLDEDEKREIIEILKNDFPNMEFN
ncbi:MAG: hypothetical protein WCG45_01750 [bacterium]